MQGQHRGDDAMPQRPASPPSSDSVSGDASDLIANNGVDNAESARYDPVSDFRMPWWAWLMGAAAVAAWLVSWVD